MKLSSHMIADGVYLLVLFLSRMNIAGHSLRPLFPEGATHGIFPPVTEAIFQKGHRY
jgi:hypothetical protein